MQNNEHLYYMQEALALARQGMFTVSPNPMVGCILVNNRTIVGRGFHERAGGPHAEVLAIESAGNAAIGATAYVTLEPCCHFGRTPPCISALIKARIKKVYAACLDPNPLVAGQGIAALQAAGIDVEVGLCEAEAQRLNKYFFHFMKTNMPYVICKWAMSLDGKTITHPDDDKKITSSSANLNTHRLREAVDAILIGSKTAIVDDPELTVRIPNHSPVKHPHRFILTSKAALPLNLKLFSALPGQTTIIASTDISSSQQKKITEKNIDLIVLPKDQQGEINLKLLLIELGKRNIMSLLVEGGMTVHYAFLKAGLVNEVKAYIAPVIIGTSPQKQVLKNIDLTHLNQDILLQGDCRV